MPRLLPTGVGRYTAYGNSPSSRWMHFLCGDHAFSNLLYMHALKEHCERTFVVLLSDGTRSRNEPAGTR
jgi:hypothetical protein